MEAIPKEVIEMAEDFFLRLSFEEKEKFLDNYYLEQPRLSQMFHQLLKSIVDKKVVNNCEYLYLIICRSYKYYGIELPVISKDVVYDTQKRFVNSLRLTEGHEQSVDEKLVEIKLLTKQDSLMDYVYLKLVGTDANPVRYNNQNDILTANAEIMVLILILNNEMKKYISDEIN